MMNRASMPRQIATAPSSKAMGRGSAKGQQMRGFKCGGKVKKYSKGGKIDGCAVKGKTNCKHY